jgi:hypothetical protein
MPPRFRAPDFLPLARALAHEFGEPAADAAGAFWFIGFLDGPDDVGPLRIYEHSVTRRRLALAADGSAYRWRDDDRAFGRVAFEEALVEALV